MFLEECKERLEYFNRRATRRVNPEQQCDDFQIVTHNQGTATSSYFTSARVFILTINAHPTTHPSPPPPIYMVLKVLYQGSLEHGYHMLET